MLDLDVIDDPARAAVALDPVKRRLLVELATPASAASLAARVGLTRQKVNYHLRALEEHKLVEPAEERRWGGLTERLMVATATSYVVSPAALGPLAADPARNTRPIVGELSYCSCGARRTRGRRSVAARARKRQAPGDVVHRYRDPVQVAGRSRCVHQRSCERSRGTCRALSRRDGAARAATPAGDRGLSST